MPNCANLRCGKECKLLYCDVCYSAHQATLTNKCETCSKKIPSQKTHCSTCERASAKRNLCTSCKQTCRVGFTQCSDCREQNSSSQPIILDRECEQCGALSDAKYCIACREKYTSVTRPCAECGKAETHGTYCEECIARYNEKRKQDDNKCRDCGYRIASGKKYCPVCITAFKSKSVEQACHTHGCTNTTAHWYCTACTIKFKASRST